MARSSPSTWRSSQPSRGVDGRGWIFGATDPTMSVGRIGECYANLVTKHAFGPKTAAGWTDNGLFKGDEGWSPRLALVSDGARRVHRVVDWAGGSGTKPATGQYVGATGLVTDIAAAADVRGPQGPEMLIDALTAGADNVTYETQVAAADPSDDNFKQPLKNLMAAGGSMTFATISAAQAVAIPARVKSVQIMTAADALGGPAHVRQRVDEEPSGTAKHRSLDRFVSDGGTDSANGGWWKLVVAPSIQATDVLVPSAGEYTNARPNVNRLADNVVLTDYVDRAQWAGIKAGTPIGNTTNDRGQDSFDGIVSDVITSGGTVKIPEGIYRMPPKVLSKWYVAIEFQKGAVFQTTSATSDQIQCAGAFQDIINPRFESTVVRTGGACIRALWDSSRVNVENPVSYGGFTLFQMDGHPTDPLQDRGHHTCLWPRALYSAPNAIPFLVSGGLAIRFHNPIIQGNPALAWSDCPEFGLKITRSGDVKVDGNPQFLGCRRPLYVCPATGHEVASFKWWDGYCGTSLLGSEITAALGGTISDLEIGPAWMGETQAFGADGLKLTGHHPGGITTAKLLGTEFPLCASNGFSADAHTGGLQINGGWADGCIGAGYAILGTKGWQATGIRAGAMRWGGNGVGVFIDVGSDDYMLSGNLLGNLSANISNGTTPAVNRVINVIS